MTKRILKKLGEKLHLYKSIDEEIEKMKNSGMKVTVINDDYDYLCPSAPL